IENAHLALEPVQVDQPLRHRRPPALDIAIAAIAVAAVAVPVIALIFFRLEHAMDLLVHHPRHVVPRGRAVQRRHKIEQPAHAVSCNPSGWLRTKNVPGAELIAAPINRVKAPMSAPQRQVLRSSSITSHGSGTAMPKRSRSALLSSVVCRAVEPGGRPAE